LQLLSAAKKLSDLYQLNLVLITCSTKI